MALLRGKGNEWRRNGWIAWMDKELAENRRIMGVAKSRDFSSMDALPIYGES
jgi:hypothetical protein